MKKQTLVKLYSDNHDGTVMTVAQYKEEQSVMSTGDWHTHNAERIARPTKRQLRLAKEYSEHSKVEKAEQEVINTVMEIVSEIVEHVVYGHGIIDPVMASQAVSACLSTVEYEKPKRKKKRKK